MMRSLQTKPYMLDNHGGQFLQALGTTISMKATSEQTAGVFKLFEVSCPPDYITPLHIYYTEDVAVYVRRAYFLFGRREERGSCLYLLLSTALYSTWFRVKGDIPARILYMTIPAGFDQFVFEQELTTPNSDHEEDAARYKIEILGPLPE